MRHLQQGSNNMCLQTLKQAEAIVLQIHKLKSPRMDQLFALTLNNFGCYYKKVRKPRVALNYVSMALKIERNNRKTTKGELASTYLNMCAIHSELQQHQEAIAKAAKAIMLIRSQLQKIKKSQEYPPNDLDVVITQSKPQPITVDGSLEDYSDLLKLGQSIRENTLESKIMGESMIGNPK
jgi:tetratricopeptide (TPR) repeat protein